jgi:hypothetical protein
MNGREQKGYDSFESVLNNGMQAIKKVTDLKQL